MTYEEFKKEADAIRDKLLLEIDEKFERIRQSVNSGVMGS